MTSVNSMESVDKTYAILKHGKCDICKNNPATENHECDYMIEENSGYDLDPGALCNCCTSCTKYCEDKACDLRMDRNYDRIDQYYDRDFELGK